MEPVGQVASSITSLMKEFRTITNNISNANTTGFKRTVNSFSKQLLDQQQAAGSLSNSKEYHGIVTSNSDYDLSQGILVKTGRTLDLSIAGSGWFTIETEDGQLYTRNGTFFTNENGQVVDSQGNLVAGQEGPVTIPSNVSLTDISVGADGSVGHNGTIFGKFKIVDFGQDRDSLKPVGNSMFKIPEDVKPQLAQDINIQQGYQESSNVNITEELVDLMRVMRTYEANMKLLNKNTDTSKAILEVAAG